MTTDLFFAYLEKHGLFRIKLEVTELGAMALLNREPDVSNFTQVKEIDKDLWEARLSKDDYLNGEITQDFFLRSAAIHTVKNCKDASKLQDMVLEILSNAPIAIDRASHTLYELLTSKV